MRDRLRRYFDGDLALPTWMYRTGTIGCASLFMVAVVLAVVDGGWRSWGPTVVFGATTLWCAVRWRRARKR